MYSFKTELYGAIKSRYKVCGIAEQVGIGKCYMTLIFTGKKTCPKTTAYSITKALNEDAEIEDYFIKNR